MRPINGYVQLETSKAIYEEFSNIAHISINIYLHTQMYSFIGAKLSNHIYFLLLNPTAGKLDNIIVKGERK